MHADKPCWDFLQLPVIALIAVGWLVTLTTALTLVTYPAGIWHCERLWPGVIARLVG